MIPKIIQTSVHQRALVILMGLCVMAIGIYSALRLPVEAFPDVTPVLVQVFTETEGLAPEEVEQYISYPVEVAMNGLPGLQELRSVSNFGLSIVNIYFEDDVDIYFARQLVNERLQLAREQIPGDFGSPEMGPISTGMGQILFYYVEDETGQSDPERLRTIQDWIIKFNLQTVPGITEILSIGGDVKQFHINVDPTALLRYDLTLHEVVEAVRENNQNVGAQFIERGAEEHIVRGIGLATSIEDLEDIVVFTHEGTPVHVNDVAEVVIGGEIRRGLVTRDGQGESVVGFVLKLIGTNTSTVLHDTKERLAKINEILPPGISIVPYYDQGTLVAKCIKTVTEALIIGVIFVVFILFVFMGSLRAPFIVALAIPFSTLFACVLMEWLGISANLMSLGGLAIAIGMLVDGAVVMVENIDHVWREKRNTEEPIPLLIRQAVEEVVRPVIFGVLIIVIVFIPLFTLQGVEGKTFRPMAQAISFAMFGSLLFAFVLVPGLAALIYRRPAGKKVGGGNHLMRWLTAAYRPLVTLSVKWRGLIAGGAIVLVILALMTFPLLGREFVPRLNEGSLLVRATMAPSISLTESTSLVTDLEGLLMEIPEITQVVSRIGRGEIGAHSDPVNNAEMYIELVERDEWRTARSQDELVQQIAEHVEGFPGVMLNFSQPIAIAVDELVSGIKAELAIKIFGDDLDTLLVVAEQIEDVVRTVPGASDVQTDQVTGVPQLQIRVNRDAIDRHGINVADVLEVIEAAIGGEEAGQVFEGVRRWNIVVRYEQEGRDSLAAIKSLLIPAPDGSRIPLGQLADVIEVVGPRQISRENNQRFISVQCNVRGRDIGSFVEDAQAAVGAQIELPPGYLVMWGGQFQLQQAASKRFAVVIPVTMALIFFMLLCSLGSLSRAMLIMLNIPLAMAGGIFALLLTGENLSVPASIGFIALFGIAIQNGLVLVSHLIQLRREGMDMDEAMVVGGCRRLRPVLITAATTILGLLPLLLSQGTGSEVQRPLAVVVIGGLFTSTPLTLFVIPALYKWFEGRLGTD